MHKSRLGNIVIDCPTDDLPEAAEFWSEALGCPLPSGYKTENKFIQLHTKESDPQIIIQAVNHDARAHLDIETNDIRKEIERLEALGAKISSAKEEWVIMEAPTGHKFCVTKPFRPKFQEDANEWP